MTEQELQTLRNLGGEAEDAAYEIERLRLALRTLKIAINVGMPEYGYEDWIDIIDEALEAMP